MKKLHARWGEQVDFVDVVIRQAHPGPAVPPYHSFEQKLRDAQDFQQQEGIPWPVVVDDLQGTVHQVYGGMADSIYLIDTGGRVAFYNMWAHVPTLDLAIAALVGRGGHGVVNGGIDRRVHLLSSITDGWRGLRRGLPQSYLDMETAVPPQGSLTWLGYQLRPLLAPLTLRATPLPGPVQWGLRLAALGMLLLGMRRLTHER